MSYSQEIIEKAQEELQSRRKKNRDEQKRALLDAYEKIPDLRAIDKELSSVGMKIFAAALEGPSGLEDRINKLKSQNLLLQEERAKLLKEAGLPANYTDLKYQCTRCNDTGYFNEKICTCLKSTLVTLQLEASGIGKLMDNQSFESFSLELYPENEREHMQSVFDKLTEYVDFFDKEKKNLLFVGGTGLGKTHLSTAVARGIIEKGYNVVYETATNMFSDFENDRFRDRFAAVEPKSDKYLECDLLIVDDLGTEVISNFSVSCLYNVINTRLNKGLPVIFSTNLSSVEIRKLYHDRITSRIFGEFSIISFSGSDIRRKKYQ